ncbi:MAG: 1-acyl-sn-glycerol-3-phosphate acyltransferase [Clostridia bacterium]|nr:1-acyl-sn-glycerol-3-phosphate acyltransferase [Clostridia bacterium]
MKPQTRYNIIWRLLRGPVALFCKLKFGYTYKPAKNLPDHYIVLSNHTTDYDCVLVACSFKRQMYYVASEHIARWKHGFGLLNWALAPILRKKGTTAAATIIDILRKVRKGANVCMFAEGVRSWDGKTCDIAPTTGGLVKAARCGLVTYRLSGGYFASPMWSTKNTRRGYLHGEPVHVFTAEQIAAMSEDEVNRIIREDLYEDAYARQTQNPRKYKGKNPAESLENLLYICPVCGKIDTVRSKGDRVFCTACDMSFTYDAFGMLHGAPDTTVTELAARQRRMAEQLMINGTAISAENARVYTVENHEEQTVAEGRFTMDAEGISCNELHVPMSEINELAMRGRRFLLFSFGKTYCEMTAPAGNNIYKFFEYYQLVQAMQKQKQG